MLKTFLFLTLFLAGNFPATCQETLVKDLDNDQILDSVLLDKAHSVIVCRLSGKRFLIMRSQTIDILNEMSGIKDSKNGFEFYNDWMRAGYKNQFRYNRPLGAMQLIGMSRYEFGNAANDGSGESSINLLTNQYIGNWNYYDPLANKEQGELIKLDPIKASMKFGTITLENFGEAVYFDFADRCTTLFQQQVNHLKAKRN